MYLTILRFLQFFLAGFLLADVYLTNWNEQPSRQWPWDLVSLIGWPLLFFLWNSPGLSHSLVSAGVEPILPALGFPVLAFLLYVAVFRGPVSNRIMTNNWITTIGGMCYTIYLFHNQLIGIVARGTGYLVPTGSYTINMLIQVALVMPPVLMACGAYFILIERPCMRSDWPKRFGERTAALTRGALARMKNPFLSRP
jgi:peptidoglycan/LPS O-acetylase OafA/YrhL